MGTGTLVTIILMNTKLKSDVEISSCVIIILSAIMYEPFLVLI